MNIECHLFGTQIKQGNRVLINLNNSKAIYSVLLLKILLSKCTISIPSSPTEIPNTLKCSKTVPNGKHFSIQIFAVSCQKLLNLRTFWRTISRPQNVIGVQKRTTIFAYLETHFFRPVLCAKCTISQIAVQSTVQQCDDDTDTDTCLMMGQTVPLWLLASGGQTGHVEHFPIVLTDDLSLMSQ